MKQKFLLTALGLLLFLAASSVMYSQPLSGSGATTDLACYGLCTGAIDVTITGGATPYAFDWSNGAVTEDISGLCPGAYDVTVTDASGGGSPVFNWYYSITPANHTILASSATGTFTINGLPLDTGDVVGAFYDSAGVSACGGYMVWDGAGSAVTAWGADSPLDNGFQANEAFTWKVWRISDGAVVNMTAAYFFGDAFYTANGLSGLISLTGTYTPTAAASITLNFTITEPAELIVAETLSNYSGYNVSANAATDGSIDLSVTGGTAPYSYMWSNGAATEDLMNIGAGVYAVTVLDANGCAFYGTWSLSEPPSVTPLAASGVETMLTCNASCDGAIDLTITDGMPPYGVIWSNGATTEDLTGLCAGTYDATITDASGGPTPAFNWYYSITPANHTILAQSATGTFTINGLPLDSGDVVGVFYDSAGVPACGGYMLWDGAGSAVTAWGADSPLDNGFQANEAFSWKVWRISDGAVVDMIPTYLTVMPNLGTYVGNGMSGLETLSGTYTPAPAGFEVNLSFTITEPDVIAFTEMVTDVLCYGNATGAIDLTVSGGTAPYIYSWSNSEMTEDLMNLAAGTYDVTITDANGCEAFGSYTIVEAPELLASNVANNPMCFGGFGTIDMTVTGGIAPYTYLWSNGATTEDLVDVLEGFYEATVTDANGCTVTTSADLMAPAALTISEMVTNVLCFDGMNGAIDLTPGGGTAPYTFAWDSGANTEDLTGLAAGTYMVTLTDANMCEMTASYTVSQPDMLMVTEVLTNVSCNGGSDGAIDISVTGGTMPYTFDWNTSMYTTEDLTGLSEGTYELIATDANGCTYENFYTITEPDALALSFVLSDYAGYGVSVFGATDGTVNMTVAGGTAPITFNWSNGEMTEDLAALAAGTYDVTVTDANGCMEYGSVTLTEPPAFVPIEATYVVTDVTCMGGMDGAIDLTASGGVAPLTFMWSNGEMTEDVMGLMAGTYYVTIFDSVGDSLVEMATVADGYAVIVDLGADQTVCEGTTVTLDAGMFDAYLWSTTETTMTIDVMTAGLYSVQVTDMNGCNGMDEFELFVNPTPADPIVVATPANLAICIGESFDVDITFPYTTEWEITYDMGLGAVSENIGVDYHINEMFTPPMAGTFYYTIISIKDLATGCTNELNWAYTFTVNTLPIVDLGADMAICEGGSYTLDAGMFDSYLWSTGETTMMIDATAGGLYSVEVIDMNGCMGSDEFELFLNPTPIVDLGADMTICEGGSYTLDANMFDAYSWSTGETTMTIDVTMAGTYSVEVTDGNGCVGSDEFELFVNPTPVVDLGADMTICEGGSYTLDAGMFDSYLWSTGETSMTIEVMAAGFYSVEVTDANGCMGMDEFELTVDPLPVVSSTVTTPAGYNQTMMSGNSYSLAICSGDEVTTSAPSTASLNPASCGELRVQTEYISTLPNIPSQTIDASFVMAMAAGAQTISPTNITGTAQTITFVSTAYYDANGNEMMDAGDVMGQPVEFILTVNTMTVVDLGMDATICDGDSYTLHAGMFDSFMWSTGETTMFIEVTMAGIYSVEATDANGCMGMDEFELFVNPTPVVDLGADMAICEGGTYTLDAGMFDAYMWSTGETTMTIEVMTAGLYSVEVTDANGCMGMDEFELTVDPLPVVTNTVTTSGGYNQMMMPGGSYSLSTCSGDTLTTTIPSTTSLNPSACGELRIETSIVSTLPNIASQVVDVSFAMAVLAGDQVISPTNATTMVETITFTSTAYYDVNGDEMMDAGDVMADALEFVLSVYPLPVVDLGMDMAICEGDMYTLDAGMFDTYMWSTGETTMMIDVTVDGTYSVEVTDANGCLGMDEFVLTVNPTPVVDLGMDMAICEGDMHTLDAGVFDTYMWSTGESTMSIDVTMAGTYSVSVTDMNGCMGMDEFMLTVNPLPVVDLGGDQYIYVGDMITLDAGMFDSYLWSNGETTQTIDVMDEGTYSVEVIDINECMGYDDMMVYFVPEVTDITLEQTSDMLSWDPIPGDLANGFVMALDPLVAMYHINVASLSSTVDLAPGMYGFNVDTYPADWFSFWAARGVTATPTGSWEDQMWLIINSNAPIFYLKVDALGGMSIIDGISYDFSSIEEFLRVSGDYLTGAYTFSGFVTGENGVSSDLLTINWEFSGTSAAIQAAIDGTTIIAPATVSVMNGMDVVFDASIDYPTFSPSLPQDLLTDALIGLPTPFTAGAIVSIEYNGNPMGTYTALGTETSLWLSQALGLTRYPLYSDVDATWTITISGLAPGMYDFNMTGITATALNFDDPANRYELATALTVIDVYTVAPDITEMLPVDGTLLDGWVTLTITTEDLDDEVTYLEVDITKVGVVGSGQTGGQWFQFDFPTDPAQIAQINAAYVGIAVLGYNAGVFTLNINTQAVANPFLDFPGWGDGEYIFWYIAYDEYGNQSGAWGDPMNPVDHISYLIQTQYDSQTIQLVQGYSIISTFIDPAYPNVANVFGSLGNTVELIKDEIGNPYWPAFGLNNVGNMVIGEGYQIKMASAQNIEILGDQVVPETNGISLPAGWSLFGYLRTSAMNAVDALSSVTSDINVIKTGSGLVYWPAFGYNSIVNMEPGVGYKARMLSAATLLYPANTAPTSKSSVIVPVNKVYANIQVTGNDMTLGIPVNVWDNTPAIGDEVAVYSESGRLVGAGVYTGDNLAITIWGNNSETAYADGMVEGSTFSIKLMRVAEGVEETIVVNEWAEGNGLYVDNAIAVIGKMTIAEVAPVSQLFQNIPNPVATSTEIRFFLANETQVTVSIYNVLGEKLQTLVSETMSEGAHTVIFNAENYAVGNYMYTIETPNFTQSKQMTVVR